MIKPSTAHSREIDSLRCIAMTAVVAMHSKILPFGWTGVWLFFVISGYVVTLSIARHGEVSSSLSRMRKFFSRRAVRILPVYYLFVAVGVLVTGMIGIHQNPYTLLSLVAFYHNIAMATGFGDMASWPVGHLWTISIEMQFYLCYGLITCLCRPRTTVKLLIAFLIAAPVARALSSAWLTELGWDPLWTAYAIYAGPGLHFDSFAIGALLAWASMRIPLPQISRVMVPVGFAAITLYCAIYLAINWFVLGRHDLEVLHDVISGVLYGQGREIFLYSALGLFSLAVLLLAATRHRSTQWLLGQPALQWVGKVSYGGYVYHTLCMKLASQFLFHSSKGLGLDGVSLGSHIALFVTSLALTLALAGLSFRFLEMPVQRFFSSRQENSKL